MQIIHLKTRIAAPAMRVFLLSLSVELHQSSTKHTDERAVAGVTSGLLQLGDQITWQAKHFGLQLRHTSKITSYLAPVSFTDEMVQGAFRSFEHLHRFEELADATLMRDELRFSSPAWILGVAIDRFVLCDYLSRFLNKRNLVIKQAAESDEWKQYIPIALHAACEFASL